MNGILIIDKPAGITSHDVVSRVRRILKTKRVGHTGTLDPFATGVMVILVGQATRLAQFLDKDKKEYEAAVKFGFETDTGDRTGTRREAEGTEKEGRVVTITDVENVLTDFRGKIDQIPPMYSAKKVEGKKLYELARKGETIDRKPVRVRISEIAVIGSGSTDSSSVLNQAGGIVPLRITCSAGTYIRALAEDIGRKIGVGAHLTELKRIRAGKFSLKQSVSLEKLGEMIDPASALVPMEEAVSHLASIVLNEERTIKTKNGLSTRVRDIEFADGEPIQMLDVGNKLIAIGT
ncbi:MAG: tRNA pseudouridine(55) synthase TruB, partial [Pyrinomonadaceae bacterium]